MKIVIGNYYMTRKMERILIVDQIRLHDATIFVDHLGRMYHEDGVPTSAGVSDDHRIVSEA